MPNQNPSAITTDDASLRAERWHELVSRMGAEIATPLTAALERIHGLTETGQIDRAGLRALKDEVERARQIGMIGQQLARFASGRVHQSPERLQLADIVNGVLAHRARETRARGITLKPSLKPVSVVVDPSLLFAMLNTTVDWALANAQSLVEFAIDLKTWPVRARIVCRFSHRPPDEPGDSLDGDVAAKLDSLVWRLLEQTAWAMGLLVDRRNEKGNTTLLVIEFPRTVGDTVDSLISGDVDDDVTSTNSKALAGSHVLVISARRELRIEIREAVKKMNLLVDFVGSVKEAAVFCKEGLPHAIIFESLQAGERFTSFRDELLAEVPSLVFIEIVEEGSAFEMSGLNGATAARVGRPVIGASLPAALMFELTKSL
ncbi:MAG: hypothetical protein ABIV63_13085 [Caldimonas sp.]